MRLVFACSLRVVCPTCGGEGKLYRWFKGNPNPVVSPCKECRGTGWVSPGPT